MAYYDDMSEGAALNYLAGLEDAGDLAALRQLALDISAGTVAGALSVSGAITGGSTGAFTGAVTAAGVTSSAAVQAAAASGFVVGASGPKILSGTGSPESVVSAPVGSTWTDTAATTGAVAWRKVSGTGSSGWVVEYGDTGWRNVAALASATTITYGILRLRRSRDHVTLHMTGSNSVTTATAIFAVGVIPVGFRPNTTFTTTGGRDGLTSWPSPHQAALEITSGGGATFRANNAEYAYLMAQWSTSDAWPTSLPGSAA